MSHFLRNFIVAYTLLVATPAAWALNDSSARVLGIDYNFTYVTDSYDHLMATNSTLLSSQPWFGEYTGTGQYFAGGVGYSMGLQVISNGPGGATIETSPLFAASSYMFDGNSYVNAYAFSDAFYQTGNVSSQWNQRILTSTVETYALATAAAPEIDGSLAPKVGFLLGCLFLMFGRKKQNTEPMMTA